MTVLETVAVLSGALFTGGAVYVSVVEHPARMRLAPRAADEQFRASYRLAAPWQAGTAMICALSGLLASLMGTSWTWAAGGVLIGLAVPYTVIVILPINRRLLDREGWDDGERHDLMRRWARLHWIRSAAGVIGLLVLISAALHQG